MSVTRRDFLARTLGVSSALALAQCSLMTRTGASKDRPNIIIFYLDDLGYGDLGCYGGDIPTPNMDALAQKGIRFTDFYVAFPACTPSRYALLTGRYSARSMHGLDNVIMPGSPAHLDRSEKTLAEFLKPKGYATGIFGKWHLGCLEKSSLPMSHGFDEFTGLTEGSMDYFSHTYTTLDNVWYVKGAPGKEKGYSTDLIANHALQFIDRNVKKARPYFAYVSFNAPHFGLTDPANVPEGTLVMEARDQNGPPRAMTLQAPPKYIDKFAHVKDPYRRYYSAMVSSLDDNIGRVLDYLEKNNQMQNTLIWLASDNGGYSSSYYGHSSNGPLRGQKGALYEGGIRVPGMVCWEGKIRPNQTLKQTVGNVDIVPSLGTIVGFSGALRGLPIDGRDISGVLFQGAEFERELIWTKPNKTYAVRKGPWKLVGIRKDAEELYNLDQDISEKNNIADRNPEKLQELRDIYQNFLNSFPKDSLSEEAQG